MHYEKAIITQYLADLLLKESVADYYHYEIRDSISEALEIRLNSQYDLDSLKLQEDIDMISSDPDLTKEYFNEAKEILKSLRDSLTNK